MCVCLACSSTPIGSVVLRPDMSAVVDIIWMLIWFNILILVGWFLYVICASVYVFVSPLQPCCPCLTDAVQLLERGAKVWRTCSQNMVSAKPLW